MTGLTPLPLTQDHEAVEEPDDFWFDDGVVYCLMTIRGKVATLHDFALHDRRLHGGRSGGGRAAMARMRPHFERIVADGVGDPHPARQGDVVDYREQLPFQFWSAMLREGLVDEMVLACVGTRITVEMLDGPIETPYGVIEPPSAPGLRP